MADRKTVRLMSVAALLASGLVGATVPAAPAASAADENVTVKLVIERVAALVSDLDTTDAADFYPQVTLAGTSQGGHELEVTDDDVHEPGWTFTASVPLTSAMATAPVRIELYDADGAFNGPRDHVDITTGDKDFDLDLVVNLTDCALKDPTATPVTGDVAGTCGTGIVSQGDDADDRASIRVNLSVEAPDTDGDGLLDAWELRGFDTDGVAPAEVDLPAMGARVDHKDLFLELDATAASTLGREDVLAMKKAFAAAPVDAGTRASERPGGIDAKTNPDGRRGITLHVDTGTQVDRGAREGQPLDTCSNGVDDGGDGLVDAADGDCSAAGEYLDASTEDPRAPNCNDGMDNDADSLSDAQDPDCLLGDNLGGGSVIAAPSPPACNLDAPYYATKATAFAPVRARIFRWALSLALDPSCPASGGWGELGGNDFMDFNFDAGTVMHELGHTLNLDHGGFESLNCKPNYVSGMNYDNQFGLRRVGGGSIVDFAPPRLSLDGSTRGVVPGPLDEAALDENELLDATDASNRFVYVDSGGNKRLLGLDRNPNYNNDTDPPLDPVAPQPPFAGNVDTSDTSGNPADCTNASSASKLVSQNDWLRISLPFRQFGDSADGPIDPVTQPEMTKTELQSLEDSLNRTDLSVSKSGPTGPVAAGTTATYVLTVANGGRNAAPGVTLLDTLPAGTTYVSDDGGCTRPSASTLQCGFGELLPAATRSVRFTVAVARDLVHLNGSPLNVVNTAVGSAARGSDPDTSNNTGSASTRVVAVADLGVTATIPTPPSELVIGVPRTVELSTLVTNVGPSAPMDVRLTATATAQPGSTASPSSQSEVLPAVDLGPARAATSTFTIACTAPGERTFTFRASVAPDRVDDSDPRAVNDAVTRALTVDCIVPVAINIKPGGDPNAINRNSSSDVPVAVLTTRAGEYGLPLAFDAAAIRPLTVRFGPIDVVNAGRGSAETHGQNHLERSYELDERTRDADRDGVLHFAPIRAELQLTTTEACTKGKFSGPAGQLWTFLGCGPVHVIV